MTRRTNRLTAENLERRTMMAADMGTAAAMQPETAEVATPEAEVYTPENEIDVEVACFCGVTTNVRPVAKKFDFDVAAVDAAITETAGISVNVINRTDLGVAGNQVANNPGAVDQIVHIDPFRQT